MDIGDMGVPFIYQGEELIYPEYVKDGLVLHYDFSGMTNNDASKDIARDLSGNGNHGTLQNFNFTPESGYDKNKLLFDGVDDSIENKNISTPSIYTFESTFKINSYDSDIGGVVGNYRNSTTNRNGANISTYGYANVNSIRAFYSDADKKQAVLNFLAPKGVIYHVVLALEKTSEKLYVNGVKVREASSGYTPNDPESSSGYELGIWDNFNMYRFDGNVYSARMYNRPLTPEEISHNYEIEKERFGIE